QYNAAIREWELRKKTDLSDYWPRERLYEYENGNDSKLYIQPEHGFTHWWMMFNPRQLLGLAQLLKSILTSGQYSWEVREYVLGAFQQYLRNQNSYCFWDISRDCLAPHMSNNNYHPKNNVVENCAFGVLGRGNWTSCTEGIIDGASWAKDPWEPVSVELLRKTAPTLAAQVGGKSEKVRPGDPLLDASISSASATELIDIPQESIDLVITDPPFGSLIHYSDLADFFYVWLRLPMKGRFPPIFSAEHTPKTIEVIANKGLEPEDPNGFYQRLLTECWREAHRILKPGGILAFTFHHSEDDPWVAVLESLFDAGFYLEATYPIRSDETKGEGEFGSKTIEYDMIHICRKRTENPKP